MFEDVDEDFEESPPPEESDNRTFLIAAGVLGGVTLLALICMAAYVLLIAPGQRNQRDQELTAIAAQNTEAALVNRAQTQTASAPTSTSIPTSTGTATSSPTSVVVRATATSQQTLATTDDLTAELIAGIAAFAPQLLDDLTGEMLLAMRTEILEALPDNFLAGLDPVLQAQIELIVNPPNPDQGSVTLPDSWTQAAAEGGDTVETTDDLTVPIITENGLFNPALLDDLTPQMLLAMPVDALEQLPDEFVAGLDPQLQAQIEQTINPPDPDQGSVALPDSWTQAAAEGGDTVETTDDLTVPIITENELFEPALLEELTGEMLLAMRTEILEALPDDFLAGLEEDVRARIEARLDPPDPDQGSVALPDSWTQAAAEGGVTVETTDDLTVPIITENGLFDQALLDDLTPEMLLSMPVEALEQLPDAYVAGLDPQLQAQIEQTINPPDPDQGSVALPDSWTQAAAAGGDTVETTDDLTVPIITENELFEPALLEELTGEMLLAMRTEILEALPDDFLAGLEEDVRARIEARLNPPDPDQGSVALPASWTQAAAAGGDTVETTDDLTVPIITENGLFEPALLDDLTPEMLLSMPVDALEQLPDEFVAGLDPQVQAQIEQTINPRDPDPDPVGLPPSFTDAAIQLTAAPTVGPRTATVAALLTQAAQQTATVLPTATALPGTGFADDVGAPSLLALAVLFIVVIFLARRLRKVNA